MDDIDIFSAVLELQAPDERQRYLDEACGENDELRDRLETLLQSFQNAGQFLESSPAASIATRQALGCAATEMPGHKIGPYTLRKLLGEGGMGAVYEAAQEQPIRRTVALKIIKLGMDSREVLRRFEAERQALSAVDHPHIAKVLDAGTTAGGRPYFVMEFVRGLPITEFCKERSLTMPQRLKLFLQVCRAIQHAHQKGIIHRDIKPTNVLVSMHDEAPVSKVIDFGIAKATGPHLTAETVHTAVSQMMGTPLYMSPEQADMNASDVDTRTDVYSLGVVLYELLTGTTPFDKERLKSTSFDEMRRIIREEEPETVSMRLARTRRVGSAHQSSASIPHFAFRGQHLHELDWIVMKALEKDRNRRYESASALAADIERHLADQPVEARPAGWWLRASKWRRRNPVMSVIIVAATLLTTSLVTGALWHNRQLTQALAVSDRLAAQGLDREAALRRELYVNDMRLAWGAATAGDLAETRRLVERHRPQAGNSDYTGFEWRYLGDLSRPPLRTLEGHRENILAADVSPDGRWIASGDKGGEVRIWDLESGRLVKAWKYSDKEVTTVRFSPDGKRLATGGQDRTTRIWNAQDWEEIATLEQHDMTVCSVVWSPDGKRLVSTGRDQAVHVWDVDPPRLQHTLPKHSDVVRAAAWSPDGRLLATTDGALGVYLWNAQTFEKKDFLRGTDTALRCLAFSPDSRLLAASGYDAVIQVFNLDTKTELARRLARGCWSLTFLDDNVLAGGAGKEGLQFWLVDRERKSLDVIRERTGGLSGLRSVVAPSTGKLLVIASEEDRQILVYDKNALLGRQVASLQSPLALMPNRGLCISADDDGHLIARRISDGESVIQLRHGFSQCRPAISLAENLIALAESDRQVRILETKTWQPLQQLTLPAELSIHNLDFSADEQWLAAGCEKGVSGVWNVATGAWTELKHNERGEHGVVRFSPSGKLLACFTKQENGVEIWDLDTSQLRCKFQELQNIRAISFSPDGRVLATGADTSDISLWDTTTGERIGTFSDHEGGVTRLAFSPDGHTLVSAAADNTVRLWSLPARRELFVLMQDVKVRELGFLESGSLWVCEEHALSTYPAAATSGPSEHEFLPGR